MMIEDLGLSLSLGPKSSHQQQHPNFMNQFPIHKNPHQWTDIASPEERGTLVKRIDVNRSLVAEERDLSEGEEEANSAVSSVMSGGKRDHYHTASNNNKDERSEGISDEDDADGSRKKLRLSKHQSAVLEESFKEHNTLNPKQKLTLAKQLNLRARQVEVWFQNRRARTKLKQTEVDCEFLKRCCENLTEENRRLQKEVQELRALKLSPQLCMQMTPPTTLTMCPSCQRISSANNQHRPTATNGALWAPMPFRAKFLHAPMSLHRS